LLTKRQPREHRTHTPSNRIRPCGELMPPGLSGSTTMACVARMGVANARETTGAMGTAARCVPIRRNHLGPSLDIAGRGALHAAILTRATAFFTGSPLCRARASQCEGVLAWVRA